MQLLSEIKIHRPAGPVFIQLLQGDLSAIPKEHATDILVISAYPGDYTPLEGSLIGALYQKGLDVKELARSKAADLSAQLHCWLSSPLSKEMQQRLNVKRVLCFEPGNKLSNPDEVVGNIFRCINAFAFEQQNNVVALPVVAAGHQKIPLQNIFPALLDSAIFWLENGLPLKCIKLVIYKQEQVEQAVDIFEKEKKLHSLEAGVQKKDVPVSISEQAAFKNRSAAKNAAIKKGTNELDKKSNNLEDIFSSGAAGDAEEAVALPPRAAPAAPPQVSEQPPMPISPSPPSIAIATDQYDFFISYAHTHAAMINSFVDEVKKMNGQLKIFYDRDSIPSGSQWIRQLSAAIQKAKKVLVFLSPDYDKSPVCWDEFQCAKLMEYNKRQQIIQTIYLYDYNEIEMPPIMGIYSYIDCREGDHEKLKACIEKIL